MRSIKFICIILLIFPLTLFGQLETKIIKIPDFLAGNYFSKKDSILRTCFCFDKEDKQILPLKISENIKKINYCKILQQKNSDGRSYWKYDLFIKNNDYEIFAEYINIDNINWLIKIYKNNIFVSEKNLKVTNKIIGVNSTYSRNFSNDDFILKVYRIMKTTIE
ncbi:hypothetical protein [Lutibacter sp.]|uniref:hypothetical protein n=1 Tax=Lutibacter sp. TaxID=1925666 RepID=UPI0025B95A20|nr:hypothetical protein [Lutibacter sp.]MCF6169215.1 hypothetical protein [Lutibacter sp.]